MSVSDLDCVELELDDEDDQIIDDRCLRNRINDFINSKLRGNLKTDVAKPSNNDRSNNVKHEPRSKRNARKNRRNKNASNKRGKRGISTSMNNNTGNDALNRDQHSTQKFRREMLFRPVTEIMRNVNRNRPRYTDIVSVEKQRSRRRNKIKQKKDTIIDDASSSDSDAEEMQRTELLEQFMLSASTQDSNIDAEYW